MKTSSSKPAPHSLEHTTSTINYPALNTGEAVNCEVVMVLHPYTFCRLEQTNTLPVRKRPVQMNYILRRYKECWEGLIEQDQNKVRHLDVVLLRTVFFVVVVAAV